MKKVILAPLVLISALALAQSPQQSSRTDSQGNNRERSQAPSYSDLYCSGFISNENIPTTNTVASGVNSPNETLYATGNLVFLNGNGFAEGSRYNVLRPLHDPNRYEPFQGQRKLINDLGQAYADIGRVRVVAIRDKIAVAEVEFTCQNVTIGDLVVPFQEHPAVTYRKETSMERFPTAAGKLSARIVMAREFDTFVGTGQKVYLSAGANKGVKVGDYFRAVRGFDLTKMDAVDATGMKAPVGDDTQKYSGKLDAATSKLLPLKSVGEMIVLNVSPTSATAMITYSVESIQVGDQVELEESANQ